LLPQPTAVHNADGRSSSAATGAAAAAPIAGITGSTGITHQHTLCQPASAVGGLSWQQDNTNSHVPPGGAAAVAAAGPPSQPLHALEPRSAAAASPIKQDHDAVMVPAAPGPPCPTAWGGHHHFEQLSTAGLSYQERDELASLALLLMFAAATNSADVAEVAGTSEGSRQADLLGVASR
jgi:hypothetical protein